MLHNVKVSEVATGRWKYILAYYGVDDRFLRNRHGECPFCGGKDRYRFDDKQGRGTWYCNQCGSGDGFTFLERMKGWSYRDAAQEVERIVGGIKVDAAKPEDTTQKMRMVKKIWDEAEAVTKGDPVWLYLKNRAGLEIVPATIRFHPALAYFVDGQEATYHPALVAAVTDQSGIGVGVHRIYLDSTGNKAKVHSAKKLLTGKPLAGAAVRLSRHEECLGIAEGIETALAASVRFSVPVWSAINANMLEQWVPPESVRKVIVFGDNDRSYTGQAAAYSLAKALMLKKISVEVRIPEKSGTDWADEVVR